MEDFLTRRWIPGCGVTSMLSRGETLTGRWLHATQPNVNQPVGLGFSHRTERYRPGGCPFIRHPRGQPMGVGFSPQAG